MIANPWLDPDRSTPKRFAVAYVLWSLVWVIGSDFVAHVLFHGPTSEWEVQSFKGVTYVLVSGLILFLAIRERDRGHRAERAATESMLRSLRQSGLVGIYVWDGNGRVIDANETSLAALGYTHDDLIEGKLTREKITPSEFWEADRIASQQVVSEGRCALYEKQVICKDGRRLDVLVGRASLDGSEGGIGYALDITELKRARNDKAKLEQQLIQSEKLHALGQLAAGIAHDFNNLLSVVMGYASIAESRYKQGEPLGKSLIHILGAAEKARSLIKKLLVFSRHQIINPETIDVNRMISDLHPIISRLIGEPIELVLELGDDVGSIQADQSQIEQVILNLAVNARDAMPNGGRLLIATSKMLCSEGTPSDNKTKDVLEVRVTDTGFGISAEVLPRIFEPFFTTKEKSGGTGLGLSTVYGIVKQSSGDIKVESVPAKGTTFTITLPRVPNAIPTAAAPSHDDARSLTGTETVLVVEDLDELREMMALILQSKGYRVLKAIDGENAVQTARSAKEPIDLVITDVVMPRLNGPDAIELIRRHKPDVKVIFITGYADKTLIDRMLTSSEILEKPLRPDILLGKVRALLDADSLPTMHAA